MLSKMRSKIMCFLEPLFGRVLGRVLGEFWEAETLDFRICFVIFSKQIFKAFFGRLKNRKKERQPEVRHRFWAGPAECARPGGEIERG